jgi:3-methyladenine DNA glycosylase AlkD
VAADPEPRVAPGPIVEADPEPRAATDATEPRPTASTAADPHDTEDAREHAKQLGRSLGALIDDVDRFAETLERDLRGLADPAYRLGLDRVAPGIEGAIGVRSPVLAALVIGLRPSLRAASAAEALWVAERLSRSDALEMHQVALAFLRRSLPDDPERTWQLIRRLGRNARDWISVDSLGIVVAEGILREPYRWSEIEQLVFAESPWERRLAAATVAELRTTARDLAARRVISSALSPLEVRRGLNVVRSLIGDADPNVQKALSWAVRELAGVDREQVTEFMHGQAEQAAYTNDGNRAWVLRDALSKLDPADGRALRQRLEGLRRVPRATSTSNASRIAARFGHLPDPRSLPEPPL